MSVEFRRVGAILGAVALVAACTPSTESPSQSTSTATSTATTTATAAAGAPTSAQPVVLTPLLVSVVAPPVPVPTTDGKVHLAYELRVDNSLDQDVTIASVTVNAGDKTLLTLAGEKLPYWTRVSGDPTPTAKLGPAQGAAIWLDVVLDSKDTVPQELTHTIVVNTTKPSPPLIPDAVTEKDLAPVAVSTHEPAVISPPLYGERWLDGNSCCDMTAHRMALNPLNGQLWAAERFAIDYVQLSPDGTMFKGDSSKPESFPYFGSDIHAVADGPVVAVLDGLPEQVAGRSPTGLPLDQYGGNHVVQDIGNGNFAFYAHLKTGSVKVKVGDQLSTGQVLANLGNSGNTDAPHLHFHVMSAPDPLLSNGLPFVFKSFTLDGRLASTGELDGLSTGKPVAMQPGLTARQESNVSPLVLDVMSYAGG
jgi:Peptidase family M23